MLKYIVRCIDLSHRLIDTSFPVNKIIFSEHSLKIDYRRQQHQA